MSSFKISHGKLCDVLLSNTDKNISDLCQYIKANYEISNENLKLIEKKLTSYFMPIFKTKLKNALYRQDIFKTKNAEWLNTEFHIDFDQIPELGRRKSNFKESSRSSKYRKIQEITDSYSEEEIRRAFLKNLRDSGKKHLIKVIEDLLNESSQDNSSSNIIPFSEDECIALIQDAKLSKWQYELIRKQAKENNADIFLPYKRLYEAKNNCYVPFNTITEKEVTVRLQDLLNHISKRILQIPEVSEKLKIKKQYSLKLTSKWGLDGASGHSQYKQRFSDGTSSDESIFMISLVPIILEIDTLDNQIEVWKNPQPGSTRYCCPIKFFYEKESQEQTLLRVTEMKEEISLLFPSDIEIDESNFKVTHSLKLTMIDGKVCTALTETTSPATCNICGATPTKMNNLKKILNKAEKKENFQYGLSTLHAWIRFMECILHIAYRLKFRKWQAKEEVEKNMLKTEKTRIQKEFREKNGLLVDYPKQGSGSSNDGNTARRFFQDPKLTSDITGVDKSLIERFGIILQTLVCGIAIDTEKFGNYTRETAELYVSLYDWFYMPASVHKILIHGSKIIEDFIIPIGQLSEEAQESRNKDVKHFREFNTRKSSRIFTNEDLMHKLQITSDPYISSIREKAKNKKHMLNEEALKLLKFTNDDGQEFEEQN